MAAEMPYLGLYELAWMAVGACAIPATRALLFAIYLLKVATYDAASVARHGKLVDGASAANWLWIVPRVFARSFVNTAIDCARGMWRSI